jgi:hypothetical protein
MEMSDPNSSNTYLKIFSQNGWLLLALYFSVSLLLQTTDMTFISTSTLVNEHLQENIDSKYKTNDPYLQSFEEDLEEFDEAEVEDFDWEGLLWDSAIILTELLIVIPSLSIVFTLSFVAFEKDISPDIKVFCKITLIGYFVFLLPDVLSILWFTFVQTQYDLSDVIGFRPLSLASIIDSSEVSSITLTLLKPLNLFDLLFIVMVGYGLWNYYKPQFRFTTLLLRTGSFYFGALYTLKVLMIIIFQSI